MQTNFQWSKQLFITALIFILMLNIAQADNTRCKLTDYPVSDIYTGKKAKPNINSTKTSRLFRTAIRTNYAHQNEANFAGHYIVTSWGCGTMCTQLAIVDMKTGHVYDVEEAAYGARYNAHSHLLILVSIDNEELQYFGAPELGHLLWNEQKNS
jgi:hypothetical protein